MKEIEIMHALPPQMLGCWLVLHVHMATSHFPQVTTYSSHV